MLSSLGLKPSNVTSLIDSEKRYYTKLGPDAGFATRQERDAFVRFQKRLDEKGKGEVANE
jgi:hypothetical protein